MERFVNSIGMVVKISVVMVVVMVILIICEMVIGFLGLKWIMWFFFCCVWLYVGLVCFG